MIQIVVFSFCVLICAGLTVVYLLQKVRLRKARIQGLLWIKQVKELTGLMQKHRGWTLTCISGDPSIVPHLASLRAQIDQTLVLQQELAQYERWQSIREHWQRLSIGVLELSPANCFKQHTQLIGSLLFLIEEIAADKFLAAECFARFKDVDFYWRDILQLQEAVGQARGLGSAVATSKICSRIEHIQLSFLRNKITQVSEKTFATLLEKKYQPNDEVTLLMEKCIKQSRYLSAIIEHQLVDAEKIDLDAKQYFATASECIATLDQVFEKKLKLIETFLKP